MVFLLCNVNAGESMAFMHYTFIVLCAIQNTADHFISITWCDEHEFTHLFHTSAQTRRSVMQYNEYFTAAVLPVGVVGIVVEAKFNTGRVTMITQ